MAHSDRLDPLPAQRGSLGPPQVDEGGNAIQLDMFGAPTRGRCGPGLEGLRTEIIEILGEGPAAPEPPGDDTAQLRLEFLRAELTRVDAG